jgi:cytochrome c oxidase subunit 4
MSHEHVIPARTNWVIYFLLLGLLVLTIAVAYVDLGPLGVPVALTIATVKAVLILLYFMHVRYSNKLVWIFSGATVYWLLILLALSFNDFWARGWFSTLGK